MNVITAFSWSGSTLPLNISYSSSSSSITYDILLNVDPSLASFTGNATVSFATLGALKGLVFHSKNLNIQRAALSYIPTGQQNPTTLEASSITYDTERQYVFITYASNVPSGQVSVTFYWSGVIATTTSTGLYSINYKDYTSGNSYTMLATQLEPTFARSIFPCFDEPAYLAMFTLAVSVPNSIQGVALSNMPQDASKNSPVVGVSSTTYYFTRTAQIIPPYLLGFAVGNFYSVQTQVGFSSMPLTVYFLQSNAAPLANFALNSAGSYLGYYMRITGKPYPWPKLDMLALPNMAFDAMENPGLIMFREQNVLVDSATNPSFLSQVTVAASVAQEIAHQWFGNIITPFSWNDLWIAEGMAVYFSYLAVDDTYPAFQYSNLYFLTEEWMFGMNDDELIYAPPIYGNVSTPQDAFDMFDVQTDQKAAAVIKHIVAQLMSVAELENSLTQIFAVNGGSYNTTQFLKAMTRSSIYNPNAGINNQAYFFTAGAPVLNFSYPYNMSNSPLTGNMMNYEVFENSNPYAATNGPYVDKTATWSLLATVYSSATGTAQTYATLSPSNPSFNATFDTSHWYKANPNGVYYYRVQYPQSNWDLLIQAIAQNDTHLSVQDRAVLLSDAFAFAENGQLSYNTLFRLINAATPAGETRFPIWDVVLDELAMMDNWLAMAPCHGNWELAMEYYITPAAYYWTWDPTTVNISGVITPVTPNAADAATRDLVLRVGANYITDPAWISTAVNAVNNYLADPVENALNPEVAPAMLKVAVIHGNFVLFDKLWARYLVASNAWERMNILAALPWFPKLYKVEALLTNMLDPTLVRPHDHEIILEQLGATGNLGAGLIWEFFKENYQTIVTLYPQNFLFWIDSLVSLEDPFVSADITNFFNVLHPELAFDAAEIVEIIQDNIAWQQFFPSMCSYLTTNFPGQ